MIYDIAPFREFKVNGFTPKEKIMSSQKPLVFKKGGLHKSVGVPQGKPIPAKKKVAAIAGKYGPKAKKQAEFAKNVLTGPKKPTKKRLLVNKGGKVTATKHMQKLMGFK